MGRSYHRRRKSWKLTIGEFALIMAEVQPEWYAKNRILYSLIQVLKKRMKEK